VAGETPPAAKGNAAKAEQNAKPAAAGESVAQLVEQLDAADYGTRERASAKLAAKGTAAIAALEKAAANGNLEVLSRATGVLGTLLKSTDEATRKAADEALQHLADGYSPAAARKAKAILDLKNGFKNNRRPMNARVLLRPAANARLVVNGAVPLRIRAAAGNVQVPANAAPAKPAKPEVPVPVKPGKAVPANPPKLAVPLPGRPLIPGATAPAAAAPQGDSQQVAAAATLLSRVSGRLEQLQKGEACKKASPQSKAELRKQLDELSTRLDALRGQLDDK
jgi:uncharacterized protein (UPF0147 family)